MTDLRYLFDSDVASDIPLDAKYAAGYVDGSSTYNTLVKIRPKAQHLSISIHGAKAKCYDLEKGALTIVSGVSCAKRDILDGDPWPWLYYSVSNRPAVIAELRRQGILGKVIHWGAHYGVPDTLPRGYHALQNVSPGYGTEDHWDRSILAAYIPGFDPPIHPSPLGTPLSPAAHKAAVTLANHLEHRKNHPSPTAEKTLARVTRGIKRVNNLREADSK